MKILPLLLAAFCLSLLPMVAMGAEFLETGKIYRVTWFNGKDVMTGKLKILQKGEAQWYYVSTDASKFWLNFSQAITIED